MNRLQERYGMVLRSLVSEHLSMFSEANNTSELITCNGG